MKEPLCNFLFYFQGHLKEGYGRLISAYTMLLNQKLIFHRKVSLADKGSVYSKTCVKRPLKNRQNKDLNDKW